MPLRKAKKKSAVQRIKCTAVVPAAGASSRFGETAAGTSKLMAEFFGKPVLVYALQALQDSQAIDDVVVAAQREMIPVIYELCKQFALTKVTKIVCGGENRLQSVRAALQEIDDDVQLVAVHDGARPLVRMADIDAVVSQAATYGAAILAVPLKDTVKEVQGGLVKHTIQRAKYHAVQTPQVFDLLVLREALTRAARLGEDITDDSMAVERLGVPVHVVSGSYDNIKITTPEDLAVAAALWEEINV
ncbi:MAG: 2-C-methyl-D-erythritol 4-phosphate cytidylyltransferase [Oscillospiraceae bacterium]|nr:2-C-methyl-D-erythritol 4-phosphate cytidylyltransferase [Oscillospiraceae bacterium]